MNKRDLETWRRVLADDPKPCPHCERYVTLAVREGGAVLECTCGYWCHLGELRDGTEGVVTFTRELVGGHELKVTIPGLGTVNDLDATALWKQMADKLEEIASSFRRSAEDMVRRGPQA